jgi:urease accessory protein
MKLVRERAAPGTPAQCTVKLDVERRQRTRQRLVLADGEAVMLSLPRGEVLRGGDCLRDEGGRVIGIEAAPEPVLTITAADATQLARVAYHLGNRHVAVQVGDGWLRIAPDAVLARMVLGLHARLLEEVAPFEPEGGAYAPGGHHHGDGPGRIHEHAAEHRHDHHHDHDTGHEH